MIDGSKSSDDSDDLLSFSWVISSGPMGYQPELPLVPTLTLDHLIVGKTVTPNKCQSWESGPN